MRTQLPFAVLAAAFACSLATAPANARARVFVASYGNDANSCTFGSPCKTFKQAVNVVDAGGEVTAIDSAGFGPININKSVTITSPPGIEAGIVPTGNSAITIAPGSTATVILRGLTIDGTGTSANYGINFESAGGALEIFNCTVRNFSSGGIIVTMSAATSLLTSNTVVSGMPAYGIYVYTFVDGAPFSVSLEGVTVNNSFVGVAAGTDSNAAAELQISNSHFDNDGAAIDLGAAGSSAVNATLKNVTINQPGTAGIYLISSSSVYLSQVTISPASAPGINFFTNTGLTVYTDGTNHYGGVVGTPNFQTWLSQ